MPEARDNSQLQQASGLVAAPASGLRRAFPWIASVLVIAANGLLTYRMDAEATAGRASAMPFVLIVLLFVAIFAANHFIYREK